MKCLLALLGSFEISDGIMTHLLIGNGLVREANPLVATIVREGNFLLLKFVGVLLCMLILWYLHQRFSRVTLIATSSVVAFYGAVIAWNLGIFLTGLNLI